ncbi:MAG: hypothetical protein KAG37_06780, partial [Flavobacteriales bacterium]|nr:hypothetical protein [Flavobacteriales bacterium]
ISGDYGRNSSISKVFGYDGVEANLLHNVQIVRERFGLRSNLGFAYTNNKHTKDEWTGGDNPTDEQKLIADMNGSTMYFTLGTQLEYNFMDFGMYNPRSKWTPYAAFGFNIIYAKSEVNFGPGGPHDIYTPEEGYNDPVNEDGVLTASLKGSLGIKVKLTRFVTLFGELTAQRAFSDYVDGIYPKPSKAPDYMSSLNIGIKYAFR